MGSGLSANSVAQEQETSPPTSGSRGPMMTVNGQPPMVDEQAIILFLRQLDRALSAALWVPESRP
jgi:hypothetical protein